MADRFQPPVSASEKAGADLQADSADDDFEFSSPYESSEYLGTTTDFVVTNGHNWGSGTHYAQVYDGEAGDYIIEAEWSATDIPGPGGQMDSGEVLDMHEAYLEAGTAYELRFEGPEDPDLLVYLFNPTRDSGSRADYDIMKSVTPVNGGDLYFQVSQAGYWGIAVINEEGLSIDYGIGIETIANSRNPTEADITVTVWLHLDEDGNRDAYEPGIGLERWQIR